MIMICINCLMVFICASQENHRRIAEKLQETGRRIAGESQENLRKIARKSQESPQECPGGRPRGKDPLFGALLDLPWRRT